MRLRARLYWFLLTIFCVQAPCPAQPDIPSSLSRTFEWRNLGPGNFSGRIVDIEALDHDFRHVLVASASGGVWKSGNAGTTWEPIFENYGSASIGDIAVFQDDPDLIWVGTGEANNRNSVSWGDGVYRSTNGGRSFERMGLENTFQIARIVTHPTDPEVVYVAAVGNLWGFTGERGLFKTVDGGNTWEKLTNGLPDDGRTGATELVMDPGKPETLYVAFYERLRRPYRFDSGGANGGIFKSTDGGRTWRRLSQGLPEGDTGRIGLAIYRRDPRIVMAIIEHGFHPETEEDGFEDMKRLGSGVYRSEDGGETWQYLNRYNDRPFYYSQIRINPENDQLVYVLTRTFQISRDGGRSFEAGGKAFGRNYDYHAMWIDPLKGNRYYLGADKGMWLTHDHGENFHFFGNLPVGQFYAIGVDMRTPYYIYGGTQDNGTWGGPSFSRDARGVLNDDFWKLHWGDGMFVQVDPRDWRTVMTEAENGSLRFFDAATYRVEFRRPTRSNVTNYQNFVSEVSEVTGNDVNRLPEALFRFNWRSPLVMSSHNPDILYLGGNHLFMTVDQGRTWQIISPDLSTNDPIKTDTASGGLTPDTTGAETHCTITALSESPVTPGLIWAGTDDGKIHVTENRGGNWRDVTTSVPAPPGLWVSSLQASPHDPAVAYLTLDGHRSDNRATLVFRTLDRGSTWERLTGSLPPNEPAQIIREDPIRPGLLFLGTEFSLFVSLDGGQHWQRFMNGLPTVAVHDLVIHPREGDLIAGTHGRGIWILDDITPLRELNEKIWNSPAHLFHFRPQILWEDQSRGGQMGQSYFAGKNPPNIRPSTETEARAKIRNLARIRYYLRDPEGETVQVEVFDLLGNRIHCRDLDRAAGLNEYRWNLEIDPHEGETAARSQAPEPAGPGQYLVTLRIGGWSQTRVLTLNRDPISETR